MYSPSEDPHTEVGVHDAFDKLCNETLLLYDEPWIPENLEYVCSLHDSMCAVLMMIEQFIKRVCPKGGLYPRNSCRLLESA
jgi:hypothetical protein